MPELIIIGGTSLPTLIPGGYYGRRDIDTKDFAHYLPQMIDERAVDCALKVISFGSQALDRLADQLSSTRCGTDDILIMAAGFLERAEFVGESDERVLSSWKTSCERLLNQLTESGCTQIVLIVPPRVGTQTNNSAAANRWLEEFIDFIAVSAAGRNIAIIACSAKFDKWGESDSLAADGVEFTHRAHKRIARLVIKQVAAYVSRPKEYSVRPVGREQALHLTPDEAVERASLDPTGQAIAGRASNGYHWSRCVMTADILSVFFEPGHFAGRTVLEIGPGQYAFALLARSLGATVVCIERDPILIELGRYLGFRIIDQDMHSIPAVELENEFDGIWMKGAFNPLSLEIPAIRKLVNKLVRWSKPGGWFWVAPNGRRDTLEPNPALADRVRFQYDLFYRFGFDFWSLTEEQRGRFAMKDTYYGAVPGIYSLNVRPRLEEPRWPDSCFTPTPVSPLCQIVESRLERLLHGKRAIQKWAWALAFDAEALTRFARDTGDPEKLRTAVQLAELVMGKRDCDLGLQDETRGRVMKAWGTEGFIGTSGHICQPVTAGRLTHFVADLCEVVSDLGADDLLPLSRREQWLTACVDALSEFDDEFISDDSEGWGYYYRPATRDIEPINHLACIGRAYLRLGRLLQSPPLTARARAIAAFIRRGFERQANGSFCWGYSVSPDRWHGRHPSPSWKEGLTLYFVLEAYEAGIVFDSTDIAALSKTAIRNVFRKADCEPNALISDENYEPISHRLHRWRSTGEAKKMAQFTGLLEWIALWKHDPAIVPIVDQFFNDNRHFFWGSWFRTPRSTLAFVHRREAERASNPDGKQDALIV